MALTHERDVIVVGAGVGGLSAALGLAREGRSSLVLEANEHRRVDHWGLNLWPGAGRVLDWLGVGPAVARHADRLDRLVFTDAGGKERFGIDVANWGPLGHFLGTTPSALEETLLTAAADAGVEVVRGRRVLGFECTPRGAVLTTTSSEGKETFVARLVIACDGPKSSMRQLLGLRAIPFRYPAQEVMTAIGGRYGAPVLRHALGKRWSVAVTPVGRGQSWVAVTLHPGVDARRVLAECARHDAELASSLESLRDLLKVSAVSAHVSRWEADRVLLMGDAAHPMLPHLGLGGSQTLEDVPVIVELVHSALRSNRLDAETLSEFRVLRQPRVAYARVLSNLWASIVTGSNVSSRLLRDAIGAQLARNPDELRQFIQGLAGSAVPDLWSHASLMVPRQLFPSPLLAGRLLSGQWPSAKWLARRLSSDRPSFTQRRLHEVPEAS